MKGLAHRFSRPVLLTTQQPSLILTIEGIEPSLKDYESLVLPLNYTVIPPAGLEPAPR